MIQWLRRWMRGWFPSRKPQEDDDPGAVVGGVGRSDEGCSSRSAASQDSEPEERASAADVDREADSHSTVLPEEASSSDKGKPSEPPSGPDETNPPAPGEVVVFDGDGSDVDDVPDERTDERDASPVDESDAQIAAEGSAASRDVGLDERGPVADAIFADSSEEASTSEAVEESDCLAVVREADPTISNEVTDVVAAEDDGSDEGDSPSVDELDEPGVAEALVVSRSVAPDGRKSSVDTVDQADSDSAGTQEVSSLEAGEESDQPTFGPGTDQRLTERQSYPHRRVAPPRRIGGRRLPADSSRERPRERRFTPRPELICREAGWSASWQAIIAIPDEISVAAVHHDGDRLEETGGEFVLPRFVGKVTVTGEDGIHHDLHLEPPLIFKFPQDWRGDGRKVRGITKGHYIVMIPRDQGWRASDASVEPAPCHDDKFMAHFVYHEGDTESVPRGLDPDVSGLLAHSFTLEGASVHDDSDQGVLYVGDPPELKCDHGIVWALVGEEGRKGWIEPFQPDIQSLREVLGGRQGHMFIRVYDENTDLQDSAEFRYHRGLREIRVNDQPYTGDTVIAPSATGHPVATIEFVTTDHGLLPPGADPENGEFSIVGNKVVVPAVPDPDRFSFTLASDGGETPCVIVLPRIWWRLQARGQDPADWSDQPLRMTRDEFRDHADAETVLLLRLPGPVTSLSVGFDEGQRIPYKGRGSSMRTEIQLSEFAEYTQIEERLEGNALLTAQWKDGDFTLIRINADPAPAIRQAFTTKPGPATYGPIHCPTTGQAAQAKTLVVTEDVTATQCRCIVMTTHRPELTEAEYRKHVLKLYRCLVLWGAIDPQPYAWGRRRPLYMIDHVPKNHYYTVYYFTAESAVVGTLQRALSLVEELAHYKLTRLT